MQEALLDDLKAHVLQISSFLLFRGWQGCPLYPAKRTMNRLMREQQHATSNKGSGSRRMTV